MAGLTHEFWVAVLVLVVCLSLFAAMVAETERGIRDLPPIDTIQTRRRRRSRRTLWRK